MLPTPDRGTRAAGVLLLADISGYTGFLNGVADAHRDLIVDADEPPPAYAVLSKLLDAILDAVRPSFRLAKLEGDAVFAVEDAPIPTGDAAIRCVRACHAAFREQLGLAGSQWTCSCTACARVHDLDLKFVLHHGGWVAQRFAGQEELAGPDVILAHRLLKNHARDLVGDRPYALFSDAAVRALQLPTEEMRPGVESYDGLPDVGVRVLPLA